MRGALVAVWLLLAPLATAQAGSADTASRAYLDAEGNVRRVSAAGLVTKLTTNGRALRPAMAPDGKTVAWLVNETWMEDGRSMSGASKLVLYRDGQRRTISCEPFIRDFWFWKRGTRVAIDCGGAHFAGSEILYDGRTLKKLATVDTAVVPPGERPLWSKSNKDFRDD
jgi:hypothetical protein